MASLARFDTKAALPDGVQLTRPFEVQAHDLTAFRVMEPVDYGRSLSLLVEREIVPRLMLAHAATAPEIAGAAIAADDVETLAALALEIEAGALLSHIDAVLARGITVDTAMVDLLAPTARLLGEYWESDRCDFVEVTMGLWRLQEAVHEIAARAPLRRRAAAGGHRALFASMPGDQHNFGTVVIDEVFRRDGWATERMSDAKTSDLLKCVGDDWYDLVGLTISCDCHIARLPSLIVALRNVSRNPRLCVMVGGRIFSADPQLALRVGADGTARDAKIALKVAADLVRVRERETLVCN